MKATTLSTIAQAIRHGAEKLAGVADNPHREARLLLAHANGLTRNDLIRDPALPVDTTTYESHLARRITREPLALIVGHREFWSLEFQVSAATLIPRPDFGNPRSKPRSPPLPAVHRRAASSTSAPAPAACCWRC